MIETIPLNHSWTFIEDFQEDYLQIKIENGTLVDIPHTMHEFPLHYFDETDGAKIATYQKTFTLTKAYQGKSMILTFDGVMAYAEVYVNGRFALAHKGGYLPFSIEISPYVQYEQENLITVIVNSNEIIDIPPFGGVIDYLTYGGIYREVTLSIKETEHLNEVRIDPTDITKLSFEINATLLKDQLYTIHASLLNNEQEVVKSEIYKNMNSNSLKFTMQNIVASEWNIDTPTLYTLKLELHNADGHLDTLERRFGFRKIEWKADGFYLNNKKLKLIGLNRHQSYPYVGYAMPKRVQRKDAEILKYTLGVNIVRMSHYSQSKHFLDACDELGLLVFSEIPGWQHISKIPAWRELVLENVRDMILRDFNHPSIVIWGVRINESMDDDELYKKTNELAHQLDPTRPTGGVRNLKGSHLLEDVYTYNDFVHDGGNIALSNPKEVAKEVVPYLVTEHNGHMFPTKKYDHEERRIEHALRHTRVINAMMKDDHISGAIGWCMNDYNTHQEFGSGDRICYHGVNDIFRLPKYASYAYASQSDYEPILKPLTTNNIGDYDASMVKGIYVFTNCDYVELFKNNSYVSRFYPAKDEFPFLKHPPIHIEDFIGEAINQEEGRFEKKDLNKLREVLLAISKYGQNHLPLSIKLRGLHLMKKYQLTLKDMENLFYQYNASADQKDSTFVYIGYQKGREVKRVTIGKSVMHEVSLQADDFELYEEDTYDATRIVVSFLDQYENEMPYRFDSMHIDIDGPLQLIGPSYISLQGGSSAFYVRTIHRPGIATIKVKNDFFEKEIKIKIQVKDHEVPVPIKKAANRFTTFFKEKELTKVENKK